MTTMDLQRFCRMPALLLVAAGSALFSGACASSAPTAKATVIPIDIEGDLKGYKDSAENLLKRVYRETAADPDRAQFEEVRASYEAAAADVSSFVTILSKHHLSNTPIQQATLKLQEGKMEKSRKAFQDDAELVLANRGDGDQPKLGNPLAALGERAGTELIALIFGGSKTADTNDEERQAQADLITAEYSWRPTADLMKEAKRELPKAKKPAAPVEEKKVEAVKPPEPEPAPAPKDAPSGVRPS